MKLGYTILYVQNVLETAAFYEKAFNLKIKFIPESKLYAEMDTGACLLGFVSEKMMIDSGIEFETLRQNKKPSGIEIVLLTDDVTAAYNHAIANGAPPTKEPEKKPWGQVIAYVKDNNGALVELASEIEY